MKTLLSEKQQVLIYCLVAEACWKAEKQDRQWVHDPNHFLIAIVEQIERIIDG